ncbi:patellin-3 [Trifolium repens]|nr:patellin-3 [Trifolium repens]
MAENDNSNPTPPPPPPPHEQTLIPEPQPKPELPVTDQDNTPLQQTESETDTKGNSSQDVVAVEPEPEPEQRNLQQQKKIPQNLISFKEESNRVSDLSDSERTSLQQFKKLLTETLNDQQVSIYGVPLLLDERTDTILLKFLRAREFKVKESHTMINNTLQWRKDFNIDALLEEDLGDDLDKVVFMHGFSREGHSVCYNVYGEFQNKELYDKTFGSEERRNRFLRWRIQFLEKSIRKLDFNPGGVNTVFQVNDLKNSPGPAKKELRVATKQALQLLQDNYPEFVAKQVFINVPWWYLAFYTMINPFLTQRTKSKFVFAGPNKSPDTLFKYISPEQVPVQYGGLSVDFCDCNPDFSISDPTTEIPVKPTTKQTVEIAIYEKCIIVWELRVVGWEVSYSAEFKPDAKDAYAVIIQKATKMSPTDEPVVSNSFKVSELGKLFLTVDNPTVKKKRLLYRFKIKPYTD